MVLNNFKCNHLMRLHFNGLIVDSNCNRVTFQSNVNRVQMHAFRMLFRNNAYLIFSASVILTSMILI